jgi:hypothetical protein
VYGLGYLPSPCLSHLVALKHLAQFMFRLSLDPFVQNTSRLDGESLRIRPESIWRSGRSYSMGRHSGLPCKHCCRKIRISGSWLIMSGLVSVVELEWIPAGTFHTSISTCAPSKRTGPQVETGDVDSQGLVLTLGSSDPVSPLSRIQVWWSIYFLLKPHTLVSCDFSSDHFTHFATVVPQPQDLPRTKIKTHNHGCHKADHHSRGRHHEGKGR